jgi:hypothetical protein
VQRQVEFVAERAQWIGGVEGLRILVGKKVTHRVKGLLTRIRADGRGSFLNECISS